MEQHISVLLREVISYLSPQPNENFIDCTFGFGGHSAAILEKNSPDGKVLGIEVDPEIYKKVQFRERLILINDSYINLKKIAEESNFYPISGILFDLGLSSWDIEQSGRGFSFQREEPLDMRYDIRCQTSDNKHKENASGLTAMEIINSWPLKDIALILKEYGEERFAERIASKIEESRKIQPIRTTLQLAEIIKKAVPKKFQFGRIHPATRAFQSLRIIVNDELNNLKEALPQALEALAEGGRLVVIAFHSIEDRIVKNFFRDQAKEEKLKILTKKPVTASIEEIQNNFRSRSAKLRAALKT